MSYRIIDISKDLNTNDVYKGDPVPEFSVFKSINSGDSCNMAAVTTTLHTGTHADAPLHFIGGGKDIGSVPLSAFVGECTVIEVNETVITGKFVNDNFPRVKRLLIKSGGKAYFDVTGAEEVADMGIELIGTDSMSVGSAGDQKGPHTALLGGNVNILENLELKNVSPGRYFLLAQPIKISGVDGAPARALLLDGYLFWSS